MDTVWVIVIAVIAAIVLAATARWHLADGRRRDPGRVLETEERPTARR